MKIICFWNNSSKYNPVFFFKPETALLINNRPFYHPDYSSHIVPSLQVIIKIKRAGKYIEEKFTDTYYDSFAIGINLIAIDVLSRLSSNALPLDMAYSFDGSTSISSFQKIKNYDFQKTEFQLLVNNNPLSQFKIQDLPISFNQFISFISEYFLLKMGDLIMISNGLTDYKININDNLTASVNNNPLINLRIK